MLALNEQTAWFAPCCRIITSFWVALEAKNQNNAATPAKLALG